MADAFGRADQVYGGGLSSDTMFLTFPQLASNGLGLLVQNVSLQYTQPVRRIHELGPGVLPGGGDAGACDDDDPDSETETLLSICSARAQRTYYVVGRPEGTLQLARIFGIDVLGEVFYRTYGDPCSGASISLSAKTGCNGTQNPKRQTWRMSGAIITTLAATATAQEMMLQEMITMLFVGLNISTRDSAGNVVVPTAPAGGTGGGSANNPAPDDPPNDCQSIFDNSITAGHTPEEALEIARAFLGCSAFDPT